MKKIVALVLTLAMVMSFSMIAFAGEPEPGEGQGDTDQQRIGKTSLNVAIQEGQDEYETYEGIRAEWSGEGGYAIVSGPYKEYKWNTTTFEYELVTDHDAISVVELAPPAFEATFTNLSSPDSMNAMRPVLSYTARLWALMKNGGGAELARAWSNALVAWGNSCEALYPAPGDGTAPTSYTMDLSGTIGTYLSNDLVLGYIDYLINAGALDPTEKYMDSFDLGFEISELIVS